MRLWLRTQAAEYMVTCRRRWGVLSARESTKVSALRSRVGIPSTW